MWPIPGACPGAYTELAAVLKTLPGVPVTEQEKALEATL
jgi:hypothetical protein